MGPQQWQQQVEAHIIHIQGIFEKGLGVVNKERSVLASGSNELEKANQKRELELHDLQQAHAAPVDAAVGGLNEVRT